MFTWPTIQNFIVSLIGIVLAFCLPFLARAGVAWLKAHTAYLEALAAEYTHLPESDIDAYIKRTVKAAANYLASKDGQEKQKWVIDAVDTYLISRGIHLDLEEIVARVEAALVEVKAEQPAVAPVKPA